MKFFILTLLFMNFYLPRAVASAHSFAEMQRAVKTVRAQIKQAVVAKNLPEFKVLFEKNVVDAKILLFHHVRTLADGGLNDASDAQIEVIIHVNGEFSDFDHGQGTLHTVVSDAKNHPYIHLLLSAGADVNAQNAEGDTPLHKLLENMSSIHENYNLFWNGAKALIDAGASVEIANKNGVTSFDIMPQGLKNVLAGKDF